MSDAQHPSRRRWALQMQQPLPSSTVFDRVAFLIGTASAVWLAIIISIEGVRSPWALLLFIPVWAIMAYLVLPRLHRLLSDLYVPDYFFGRTRTGDGLLGDPVNLGVDGTAAQLDEVMTRAGWHRADEITAASTWGIIASTLTRRSYPTAPVSPLMLFGRRHDVAYQQEVAGNPKQRHHVRFWHCPPGWLLPGGAKTDWLGAGTYDTDVGLSLFTLQVTHRIDENTDVERDFVVQSARDADAAVQVRLLHDFTTGYHSRNGGGDRFITDGDLPIIDVTRVRMTQGEADEGADEFFGADAAGAPVEGRGESLRTTAERSMRRAPLSTFFAVGVVVIGAVLDVLGLTVGAAADPGVQAVLSSGRTLETAVLIGFLGFGVLISLAQLLMAWFVLRRGRRSRAILMVLLAIGVLSTAIDYLDGTATLGLNGTLLAASLQCLALLALSSESAGAWSRRRSRADAEV
ncbi:LssY C-terminal domain-containing protein [Microbacterium sp. Au-Mic1]|uniref:LssY C-terminal domain-containing protein n=1 Tax=Microbacterium sp. Au-Mic1 TaxID=2906457 RepID=UPI001E4D2F4F|nr:LssY C-terminal domain-containing protein [Microbacterium sp. Au-Mic1]MCE4027754.1 LssY C-terminal domain-containing protein [Microbacterium sp. Au-Mic1]